MNTKNILIFGNFGYANNDYNGQTIRTRTIYKSLIKYLKNYNIEIFDTSVVSNKTVIQNIKTFLRLIISIISSDKIIIMPAQKSIKFIIPLIDCLNSSKKVIMVAIGGWLNDSLKESSDRFYKQVKRINKVLVQTTTLKDILNKSGLNNVEVLPNYRIYDNEILNKVTVKKALKRVVFYARVMKEKGIEDAINAIVNINNSGYKINLDIYGPITDEYKKSLDEMITKYDFINYLGIVDPDNAITVLNEYDCMIFPTFYKGEGFPGTVLESMLSGLPIIASNWKYNSEIVKHKYNGLLVDINDVEGIKEHLIELYDNSCILEKMSKNCIEESKKYYEEKVIQILIKSLEKIGDKNDY